MEEEENQNLTDLTVGTTVADQNLTNLTVGTSVAADWVMTMPDDYAREYSLRINPQVYIRDTTSDMQDRIKSLEIQVQKLTALVMGTPLETFGDDDMMDI